MHTSDPSAQVEATFRRIEAERMTDLPLLNPALAVAAIDFHLYAENEWRGVLLTPWNLGLLLLPATTDWPPVAEHARVFRRYAAGDFAFLGNREEGLGEYLLCPLIHDMRQFPDQATAVATARACLIALDLAPAAADGSTAAPVATTNPGRRKFLSLGG